MVRLMDGLQGDGGGLPPHSHISILERVCVLFFFFAGIDAGYFITIYHREPCDQESLELL